MANREREAQRFPFPVSRAAANEFAAYDRQRAQACSGPISLLMKISFYIGYLC
jgi:hypothetical protein